MIYYQQLHWKGETENVTERNFKTGSRDVLSNDKVPGIPCGQIFRHAMLFLNADDIEMVVCPVAKMHRVF